MANTMTIDQVSTVLRAVLAQATGRTDLAALDTAQLLTIGQQLQAQAQPSGVDPVLGAISQMVSATLFSERPYTAKFGGLKRNAYEWGNMVRKLKIVDKDTDIDNNKYIPLTEGNAVDQYEVDNTKVVQLNFVGQQTYQIVKTIYDKQFNVVFNSAEEFGRFLAMIMTYVSNKIEKIHEETARATISGLIAGRVAEYTKTNKTDRVVYLITEYNKQTGAALTNKTVFAPENFKNFMEWAYAFISSVSDRMTEYTDLYQTNLAVGNVDQHTPKSMQMAYFHTDLLNQCSTRVLTNQFNKQLMSLPGFEAVNFWQNPKSASSIHVKDAKYLGADGNIASGGATTVNNIFGVLCDREALGYSPILTRTTQSPYNAAGEYRNIFWKFNERHWIDFTEKSVVFLLDTEPA